MTPSVDLSSRQERRTLEQGGEYCRDAVELGPVKSGSWFEAITANTFVDLLCSRHCAECLSYIGVFVIQSQGLNVAG